MRSPPVWPRTTNRDEAAPVAVPSAAADRRDARRDLESKAPATTAPGSDSATTIAEAESVLHWIDRTFHVVGLLVRAGVYLALFHLADRVDCGPALCGGVLLGDVVSFVGLTLWQWRGELVAFGAALTLFALLFLLFGHRFDVPAEPAQRAILGLAAFGTVAGRLGRDLLGRLSGRDDGFC